MWIIKSSLSTQLRQTIWKFKVDNKNEPDENF